MGASSTGASFDDTTARLAWSNWGEDGALAPSAASRAPKALLDPAESNQEQTQGARQ